MSRKITKEQVAMKVAELIRAYSVACAQRDAAEAELERMFDRHFVNRLAMVLSESRATCAKCGRDEAESLVTIDGVCFECEQELRCQPD